MTDNPTSLPFIVSTHRQKTDQKTRKLIRSHVMRGKNRVKPRRKQHEENNRPKAESSVVNNPIWDSSIPRLLCSKFAGIRFADDVEPALIADAVLFSSMFSKAMYLVDQCIISKTFGTAQTWFSPMLFDAAYLHAVCFTIPTYFDGFFARTRNVEAQRRDFVHYAKAVRILQERLEAGDDSERLSDSTIMTVLALSGHAYTTGDYESASNHSRGLLKLVGMRGVGTFCRNTKLLIEILRCDLGMAVDRGSKPVLCAHDNIPWPLMLDSATPNTFLNKLDPGLAATWTAMSQFCALLNTATDNSKAMITEETFLHNMGSIMYRLLHQRFRKGSYDETVRLGLLAFASPIFLHWNREEFHTSHFTSSYREALAMFHSTGPQDLQRREHLWLLMVGALSMAHEQQPDGISWLGPWLRMSIELNGVCSWDDMRDLLGLVLWVGVVYDKAGKEVFDLVQQNEHRKTHTTYHH